MVKEKIILSIVGIFIFIGLIYVAIKFDNKSIKFSLNNIEQQEAASEEKVVKDEQSLIRQVNFNQNTSLVLKEHVLFNDGLNITLEKINDSRCPRDKECIWAGELSSVLSISGGGLQQKEIILGSLSNKSVTVGKYVFTLKDITKTTLNIIVTNYKKTEKEGLCYIGGCSSEVCSSEKNVITTCEFKKEYACYKNAKCEKQASGKCGWSETPELLKCLSN